MQTPSWSILLSPVVTTLNALVFLQTPKLPPMSDDTTRLPQERTVRIVEGRLVQFKPELGKKGDRDLHLVITDDTLEFSEGNQISSHSVVAEIVKPECVPGRHGTPGTTSRFQSQIEDVWKAFNTRFPDIKHKWNDGGDVPVRLTGVGFFDRAHGQTGRARNQIEIHPVLEIAFLDSPTGGGGVNLFPDGGFEASGQGWTVQGEEVISTNEAEPPRSGKIKAWLAGKGEAGTEKLSHQVTVPANATSATLQVFVHITTDETANQVAEPRRE